MAHWLPSLPPVLPPNVLCFSRPLSSPRCVDLATSWTEHIGTCLCFFLPAGTCGYTGVYPQVPNLYLTATTTGSAPYTGSRPAQRAVAHSDVYKTGETWSASPLSLALTHLISALLFTLAWVGLFPARGPAYGPPLMQMVKRYVSGTTLFPVLFQHRHLQGHKQKERPPQTAI